MISIELMQEVSLFCGFGLRHLVNTFKTDYNTALNAYYYHDYKFS